MSTDCCPCPCLACLQQVSEWPGAHLEPADQKDSGHPEWPRGPGCDLVEDTAPGAPASQVGHSSTREQQGTSAGNSFDRPL